MEVLDCLSTAEDLLNMCSCVCKGWLMSIKLFIVSLPLFTRMREPLFPKRVGARPRATVPEDIRSHN